MSLNKLAPVCEDCVPYEARDSVPHGACQGLYENVDKCMKSHKGNVADCVKEWDGFRLCHAAARQVTHTSKAAKLDLGGVAGLRKPVPLASSERR